MSLPYPSMVFVPLDILTAEEMNQIVGNIESLAAGTGLNDGAITSDKIDSATIPITVVSSKITSNLFSCTSKGGVGVFIGAYQLSGSVSYSEVLFSIAGYHVANTGVFPGTPFSINFNNTSTGIEIRSNSNYTSSGSFWNNSPATMILEKL